MQVWFREGIYHQNPEGSLWVEVPLPGEVVQVSCGPGDLVWAVLWEGQLIVREGIGRDCPKGTQACWRKKDVLCVCVYVCVYPLCGMLCYFLNARILLGDGGLSQS